MAREVNDAALSLIKQWEGKYLTAYHGAADRPGLLTIGYGHTDAAGPPVVRSGMVITEAQADEILRNDLHKVEGNVEAMVRVSLTDNQFGALVAFVFNVGETAFQKSTLLRKLNAGDYNSVPSELMKWTRANGVQVQGLVNRRSAEAGLWAKGAFVASQFVEPDEKPETMLTALAKPETIGTIVSGGGGFFAALQSASGPIGYALAFVIVIAAAIAGFWLVKHIKDRGT